VKILGIDQAREKSGVSHWTGDRTGHTADYETMRLREIGTACLPKWRDYIVDEIACGYDLIVIECPVVLRQNNLILFQISGVILEYCERRGQRVLVVNVPDLKLYATGDHNASKEQMITAAKRDILVPGAHVTADEADALWLGHFGFHILTGWDWLSGQRQEILTRYSKTPEQVATEKRETRLAKAAAELAAEQKRQDRIREANERAQERTQRAAFRELERQAIEARKRARAAAAEQKRLAKLAKPARTTKANAAAK